MDHLTVAASEDTVIRLFEGVRDRIVHEDRKYQQFGRFWAGYDVKFHLTGGRLDLQSDNTIRINELDIVWDRLNFLLGFDIPKVCIGGWCVIPTPWGCAVRLPKVCVFESNPDISVSIPIGALIRRSEISGAVRPRTKHVRHPGRPPSMNYLQAQEADVPDTWQMYLDPSCDRCWLDIDMWDIADSVADILEDAVRAVIDGLLGWLPGWAKDIIWAILGPVIKLIRILLDIVDDIDEWISNLLRFSLGIGDLIIQFFAGDLTEKHPLLKMENPFPILKATDTLAPVKIPIESLAVTAHDKELILTASVGA